MRRAAIPACLLASIATPGAAAILSVAGPDSTAGAPPAVIAAPASTGDDAPGVEALGMVGFDEAQGVTLEAPLAVDGGTIPEGTRVDSHMIALNTPGWTRVGHGIGGAGPVVWRFSGEILGVMSDADGRLERDSGFLGAEGTLYPDVVPLRGLERDPRDGFTGDDWYRAIGASLEVGMTVSEPGDWIRVITRSPPLAMSALTPR